MCLLRPVRSLGLASSLGIVSSTWPCYARLVDVCISVFCRSDALEKAFKLLSQRTILRPWDCPCPNAWRVRPRIRRFPKRRTRLYETRVSKRSAPRLKPTIASGITVAHVAVSTDMRCCPACSFCARTILEAFHSLVQIFGAFLPMLLDERNACQQSANIFELVTEQELPYQQMLCIERALPAASSTSRNSLAFNKSAVVYASHSSQIRQ